MKVVENSPQNARNCTIFKKILGGACPQTPLAIARSFAARDMPLRVMYSQTSRNFKVGPPPLRNPAYAPVSIMTIIIQQFWVIVLLYNTTTNNFIFKVQYPMYIMKRVQWTCTERINLF